MTTNDARRGKTILIGASEAGKTTLIQTLSHQAGTAAKTMTVAHRFNFIDTPGEYIEHRSFYKALIVTAADADRIGLVLACGCDDCWIPPAFAASFAKPVFGIVTKADLARERSVWEAAREPLRRAGADPVFVLSAWSGQGLAGLAAYLGLPAPDGRALPAGEPLPAGRAVGAADRAAVGLRGGDDG
ncbi:MAG: EutP/PduV family microcompartment system protein [Propionibacteriaceae bacterium]|jgi:ethanolamine utilization protein EutP|nr:EutP/PduV family microcompartment system protein [Propionibacteriaceae bacterium]